MSLADVEALRRHDLSDAEIHDVVQVVSYFNYINRVADALGVDPEDFMRADGGVDGSHP
jgi:alkylhydroperoxidase family enzyme